MARTLMIMAGGTGGHIYSGLAVAEELSRRGWSIVWLGTRKGMEGRIVPQHGYRMAWLNISGLRGNGWLRKLVMPGMLAWSCVQALWALLHYQPDAVLGMGGYPSVPGGLMAALLRKPLLVHEQNAIAGLSNRLLACLATRVMSGFPDAFRAAKRIWPCRKVDSEWTGNPVRADIVAAGAKRRHHEGRLRLLVVGGSLGAAALNTVVPAALALLTAEERPLVVHQSGARHLEVLRANYVAVGVDAEVREFIVDMAEMYAWCDVAITRAGALTLAELAAAGVPAILVPYPHAVDDHQTVNAGFLVARQAARLISQDGLTAERLAAELRLLNRDLLAAMSRQALAAARPEAVMRVAQCCEDAVS